ncbi:MAG: VOC family protein [Actinomycetota bacterium]
MPSKIHTLTIDAYDPPALARFWAAVLDFKVTFEEPEEVAIEAPDGTMTILFGLAVDEKISKNRLHLDLNPDDQSAEVERLKGLGATEVDIGQKDVTWVVMADPEGNEFCVLRAR